MNTEQAKLLEETYKNFVRGGADLDESKKKRFSEINEKISLLTLKYGENVLTETNNFKLVIEDKNDLAGLPQSAIDEAAVHRQRYVYRAEWMNGVRYSSFLQVRAALSWFPMQWFRH